MHRALDATRGGSARASLDEVVAKLARARVPHTRPFPAASALTKWCTACVIYFAVSRELHCDLLFGIYCYHRSCAATCRLRRQSFMPGRMAALTQVGKGYAGPREALVLNGNFVLAQLRRLDAATAAGARLAESAFARALQQQAR